MQSSHINWNFDKHNSLLNRSKGQVTGMFCEVKFILLIQNSFLFEIFCNNEIFTEQHSAVCIKDVKPELLMRTTD